MTQKAVACLKTFDFDTADVALWVFKPSAKQAGYMAYYVRTDKDLNRSLKDFAMKQRDRISECLPYNYLAQSNEGGCLSVGVDQTNFALLKALVDEPEPEHGVHDSNQLLNVTGYLVKFTYGGRTVYAVRRSPSTWKTAYKKKGILNVVFRDGELSAVNGHEFAIEPNFDSFCIDDIMLIVHKAGFESVMQYRSGYASAFTTLQQIPEFLALFTTMQPLIEYVGTNTMQLRRMAVVQEKQLYTNSQFISAVKKVCVKRNWGIVFDPDGRIIPTSETAATILRILLDQRLLSEITQIMYDVPDGVPVT